jgi:uncharacterized protein YigE (DUF2233 family)
MKTLIPLLIIALIVGLVYPLKNTSNDTVDESKFLIYEVNPIKQDLAFYWKSENGQPLKTFQNLKTELDKKDKKLLFAMNAGMFKTDFSPLGLYIEKGKTVTKLNTIQKAHGNFYLQPNGIFYLTKEKKPRICTSENFKPDSNIQYATQSGPMLVIDGKLHPKFTKGATSTHFRNGVGILPNGNLLFVMSKEKVNFYDFATLFKNKKCKNALYLDGFVSKTYLPVKDANDLGGDFGVIIGETK